MLWGISVGRCVIPWEFWVKVSNIHFLVKNVSCLRKKMFPIFSCRFNVMVTSQSDVPIFAYLGLENWALWIPAGANMYCLISYSNITGDILYLEHRLWLRILKKLLNFKMMSRKEKMTSVSKWKVCNSESSNNNRSQYANRLSFPTAGILLTMLYWTYMI